MSSPPATHWRPRFSLAGGAGIALIGFLAATLAGASSLRAVFGLLLGVLGGAWALQALGPWRQRLLWRLRNRLLVAYVFIGVIPVVLLLLMGLISAWILYGNVAVSLLTDQLDSVQGDLGDEASDVVAALEVAAAIEGRLRPERVAQIRATHLAHIHGHLPAVDIYVARGPALGGSPLPEWLRGQRFSGMVTGEGASLVSTLPVEVAGGEVTVAVVFPLDTGALEYLGGDRARVSLWVLGEEGSGAGTIRVGEKTYRVQRIVQDPRDLPPPVAWWDRQIGFIATRPTRLRDTGTAGPPLLLSVESRVAILNREFGSGLGEFAYIPMMILGVAGAVFLGLELAALWMGVKLTRTITATVNDLQIATEQVQAANFSHRIRLRGRDQLSGLAQAFNAMSSSIKALIEESKEKQRLQNELEIARQVQEQLFPSAAPPLETLELVGRCRAARTVSGDYYDYGLAEPGKLILAIGDISGKGISAALLMATIQSAIRSQVYASRLEGGLARLSMAELVTRVNRQLCATTSPEKYSTLFVGHYDDATRQLTYTNAGHLPPVRLFRGQAEELTVGGKVVGLFRDATYEQATVQLQPGDWLVAYTDGLTEVENSYEEEYGRERLLAFLRRTADNLSPEQLVELVLAELQQWAPGVEPSDDRTVLAAHVR